MPWTPPVGVTPVDRKPPSSPTLADIPAVLDWLRISYGGHTVLGLLITDRETGTTYRVDAEPPYGTPGTLTGYTLSPLAPRAQVIERTFFGTHNQYPYALYGGNQNPMLADKLHHGSYRMFNGAIHWRRLQLNPGNWARWDEEINLLRAAGLRPLWQLGDQQIQNLAWTMQDWRDLITEAAIRNRDLHGNYLRDWELVNEWTSTHFWNGSAQLLVDAYREAYTILKSIHPGNRVIGPNQLLGDAQLARLPELLDLGIDQYVDAYAVHTYQTAGGNTPEDILRDVGRYRAMLTARGINKPIINTESNWYFFRDLADRKVYQSTASQFMQGEQEVAWAARYWLVHLAAGVEASYIYSADATFGALHLTRATETPPVRDQLSPGGLMTARVIDSVEGARLVDWLADADTGLYACVFERATGGRVAWVWAQDHHTVTLRNTDEVQLSAAQQGLSAGVQVQPLGLITITHTPSLLTQQGSQTPLTAAAILRAVVPAAPEARGIAPLLADRPATERAAVNLSLTPTAAQLNATTGLRQIRRAGAGAGIIGAAAFARGTEAVVQPDGVRVAADVPRIYAADSASPYLLAERASLNEMLNSDAPVTATRPLPHADTWWFSMIGTGNTTVTLSDGRTGVATEGNPVTFVTTNTTTTATLTPGGDVRHYQAERGAYPTSMMISGSVNPRVRNRDAWSWTLPALAQRPVLITFAMYQPYLTVNLSNALWVRGDADNWVAISRNAPGVTPAAFSVHARVAGASSYFNSSGYDPVPARRWVVGAVVLTGTQARLYTDVGLSAVQAYTGLPVWPASGGTITLGDPAQTSSAPGGYVAPGAPALGLPLLDVGDHVPGTYTAEYLIPKLRAWRRELERVGVPVLV